MGVWTSNIVPFPQKSDKLQTILVSKIEIKIGFAVEEKQKDCFFGFLVLTETDEG